MEGVVDRRREAEGRRREAEDGRQKAGRDVEVEVEVEVERRDVEAKDKRREAGGEKREERRGERIDAWRAKRDSIHNGNVEPKTEVL